MKLVSSYLDDDVCFGREYMKSNEIVVTLNVKYYCLISDFRREVDENCAPLCYYATSSGNSLPTFRNKLSVQFSVYPEDGTDRLSRNVAKKFPLLLA